VAFEVTSSDDSFIVEGTEDLGFFGKFHHHGTISGDTFTATYSNDRNDIGSFHLERPQFSGI
jgi:hypothetical protein